MPNRNSKADHVPERTCVICRGKKSKAILMRFLILSGHYIMDIDKDLPGRGYYVCNRNECLEKLDLWIKKKKKLWSKKRSV